MKLTPKQLREAIEIAHEYDAIKSRCDILGVEIGNEFLMPYELKQLIGEHFVETGELENS